MVSARTDGDRGVSRAERARRTSLLLDEAASCTASERRVMLLGEVVVLNRGVAESVASRFRNRGVSTDDLHQVAYLGLVQAVQRFDPDRAEDLLTFAVPTIRGEIQRHFRDHGWTIRPTRRIQDLQWRLNQCIDRLSQRLGREPTDAELRDELGLDHEEYGEVVAAFGYFQPASLDRPATSESETTVGELLGEEQSTDAFEARTVLRPVMRQLSERERRILYLRFFEDRTQQEIGMDLGMTQVQVSRLLRRLLVKLRRELEPAPPLSLSDPPPRRR